MLQIVKGTAAFILVVFLLPVGATVAWWAMQERPASWRAADWSPSGILPPAGADDEAAIYVLAARTGGLKGAFSVHSWIVVKEAGANRYHRYDKVGWGNPIRRDAYPADAYWYSNQPWIVHAATGDRAAALLPQVEDAIEDYPYARNGGYRIWPGPNSNSFVAHVLNAVPDLGARLPPNATGRDFAAGHASFHISSDWKDVHATVGGLFGFAFGVRNGIEIHFLGLVAGLDLAHPALKVPALGRVELWR